jgi:acetyl esterase/lipase
MTITQHALAAQDSDAMAKFRVATAAAKGKLDRASFDTTIEHVPPAAGITYEANVIGGISGWWCRPSDAAQKTTAILYLHGGAYIAGSARVYRNFAGHIASQTNAAVFIAEYRLAPEHPFPAAFDDALAAYHGLVKQGFANIALAGDSAGGGLALALSSRIVAEAHQIAGPNPKGVAVMSPWTDLALSGATLKTRAEADPLLTKAALESAAKQYVGTNDTRDPLVSPLYASHRGLPQIRIDVGDDEILLDDARRYAERVNAEGGACELHIWAGMPHVFASNIGVLAASDAALGAIGNFLRKRLTIEPGGIT